MNMKRDVEKAYKDYLGLVRQGKANIYASELEKIYIMAQGDTALMGMISFGFGVTVGYRLAKREKRGKTHDKKHKN